MGLIILWMDPTYGTDNNSMHGTWYDAFALKTHTHPSAHALTPHTKLMMMIITKTKTTTTTTTTSTTTKKKPTQVASRLMQLRLEPKRCDKRGSDGEWDFFTLICLARVKLPGAPPPFFWTTPCTYTYIYTYISIYISISFSTAICLARVKLLGAPHFFFYTTPCICTYTSISISISISDFYIYICIYIYLSIYLSIYIYNTHALTVPKHIRTKPKPIHKTCILFEGFVSIYLSIYIL